MRKMSIGTRIRKNVSLTLPVELWEKLAVDAGHARLFTAPFLSQWLESHYVSTVSDNTYDFTALSDNARLFRDHIIAAIPDDMAMSRLFKEYYTTKLLSEDVRAAVRSLLGDGTITPAMRARWRALESSLPE